MGLIEKYAGRSVFKDRRVLSFDYVPKELPHRESHLKKLVGAFIPIVKDGIPQNVFLCGNVGTGKTVTAKLFCREFQEYAKKENRTIEYVVVNCRKNPNDQAALLQVVRHFQDKFPDRGFSISEMLEALRKDIEKRKCHFIVVLDEANMLLSRAKSELIYLFTRFNEDSGEGKGTVSLVLVSQRSIYEMIDAASRSTLKGHQIDFLPYKANELYDILEARVREAFFAGAVSPEILELVAEIGAQENGDARFAIELLEAAGMQADFEGSDVLHAEYVRAAKAEAHSTLSDSKLEELDKQKLAVLLGCCRALNDKPTTNTGAARKQYEGVCEEYGLDKRGNTQFWKYIVELTNLGIIDSKRSADGMHGATTIIELREMPASELAAKVDMLLRRR